MAKNAKQFEERPWGSFEILSEFEIDNLAFSEEQGYEVVIKKIVVKPGQRLSYQFHKKRKEKWKNGKLNMCQNTKKKKLDIFIKKKDLKEMI